MSIEPSPAMPSDSHSADTPSTAVMPPAESAGDHAGAPPAKRRKISPEEKAAREQEKAQAKAQKEADRLKREQDRRIKEEEKAEARAKREMEKMAKEEERLKEKQAKEEERLKKVEEKKAKEEEKQKKVEEKEAKLRAKEEEKRKKEQAQPKLSAFFVQRASDPRPKIPSQSPQPDGVEATIEPAVTNSPQKSVSDYEQFFLPFEAPTHTIVAPINYFLSTTSESDDLTRRAESELNCPDSIPAGTTTSSRPSVLEMARSLNDSMDGRGCQLPAVSDILAMHQGDIPEQPIDLDALDYESCMSELREKLASLDRNEMPTAILEAIPTKYLHFSDDVRPPYCGTFTKQVDRSVLQNLMRNPFRRSIPVLEYDYDSEAEWEDPGEGEDILSDGDEDMEELDDGDEMSGFIDDDEDKPRRKLAVTEMEVKSTGLCWSNGQGAIINEDGEDVSQDMKQFRMGTLLTSTPDSIDPFSTDYWADPNQLTKSMNPPRAPFGGIHHNVGTSKASAPPVAAKVLRYVPDEHLEAFKKTIMENADSTQIHIIEVLKKAFPSVPKDAISNTLKRVARRPHRKDPYQLVE